MKTHMNFTAFTYTAKNLEYRLRKARRAKDNREIKIVRAQLTALIQQHA